MRICRLSISRAIIPLITRNGGWGVISVHIPSCSIVFLRSRSYERKLVSGALGTIQIIVDGYFCNSTTCFLVKHRPKVKEVSFDCFIRTIQKFCRATGVKRVRRLSELLNLASLVVPRFFLLVDGSGVRPIFDTDLPSRVRCWAIISRGGVLCLQH